MKVHKVDDFDPEGAENIICQQIDMIQVNRQNTPIVYNYNSAKYQCCYQSCYVHGFAYLNPLYDVRSVYFKLYEL